ncbi:GPCR kinase [Parasponia andersonii]|uniref:GPCR kinase n=1 Tax=Parasponia andersonii TaxID=3476 RepID=A0A2P5CPI7_PARAD|nr:GPCR kinase [Parasponia andersonii]
MTLRLIIITAIFITTAFVVLVVDGLGSASTAAVAYGTDTVCGIVAGQPTQSIQCYNHKNQLLISVLPNVSFQEISGGRSFFCGLRYGGFSLHCWDTTAALSNPRSTTLQPKRIYHSDTVALTDLAAGDSQVCALEVKTGIARCWRGGGGLGNDNVKVSNYNLFPSPREAPRFRTITCGSGFACGILKNDSRVICWGGSRSKVVIWAEIQAGFESFSMSSLVAGESHACGLTTAGILVCKGNNDSGQLNVPNSTTTSTNSAYEYSGLALGSNFTCGIKRRSGLVTCWGGGLIQPHDAKNVSFELIVSGSVLVCGLTTSNLSMICWSDSGYYNSLPMGMNIPGACVKSSCSKCGTYPNSDVLCSGSGSICRVCQIEQLPLAAPLPPIFTPPSSPSDHDSPSSKAEKNLLLAFLVVGLIGSFVGFSCIVYFVWTRILRSGQTRSTNEERPRNSTIDHHNDPNMDINAAHVKSHELSPSIIKAKSLRCGSLKPEIFSVSELAAATNSFSLENKIGGGSFGIVYKGKLPDGREVAIKRGHSSTSSSSQSGSTSGTTKMITKQFQEKESAFDSELASLSRLNHKHLVSLAGFCRENDERLLVYDYMSNGSLHHHLHNRSNDEKNGSVLVISSWKMRIKIALESAKGIEYLHNYAVPPVVHRDIKSSNILLDSDWTARVSDFGLSTLMIQGQYDVVSAKAVGTVGYIDPEYYVLKVLTAKSDVYGLGVVMLELLTGKRAVFKDEEEGVTSLVDYAARRRRLLAEGVLDKRVRPPQGMKEAEAVEVLADTAVRCVKIEGKDRPHIGEVVSSLERAFSLCNC